MSHHTILFGEGAQTLRHVAIDARGRERVVSAATYSIVDLSQPSESPTREIASGSATIGSETTTITAPAGPSTQFPDRLQLTSVTGFAAGRRYAIVTATSSAVPTTEVVLVDTVETPTNRLKLRYGISQAFSVGSTVRAVELEATFPDVVANDEQRTIHDYGGDWQITWRYVIDAETYLVPELIQVQRYSVTSWATPLDLRRRNRQLGRASATDIADALAAATEDVIGELESAGLAPSLYRHTTFGKVAVTMAALEHIFRGQHGVQDLQDAERYHDQYKAMMHQMLTREAPRGATVISMSSDAKVAGAQDVQSSWVRG